MYQQCRTSMAVKVAAGAVAVTMLGGFAPAQAVPQPPAALSQSMVSVASAVQLSDVANNQYRTQIQWLADRGITTGWPDGTFRPLSPVNRDAMAAFLYRLAGQPDFQAPAESPFEDVPTTNQFYKEITWAHDRGITTGYEDGTFRPLQSINRDAIAAFMYRYAGEPEHTAPAESEFIDIVPGQQFYKEIHWLESMGITTGWTESDTIRTFRPLQPIARDAMAAFLYRYAVPADGMPAYLTELTPLVETEHFVPWGDAGVDGSTYPNSVMTTVLNDDVPQAVSYDLAAKYDRFQAVLGVSDMSLSTQGTFRYEVFGDGELLSAQEVAFGATAPVDVPVTGVRTLEIKVTRLQGGEQSSAGVLGSVRLVIGAQPLPTAAVEEAPSAGYLAELQAVVDDMFYAGGATIGGTAYPNSITRAMTAENSTSSTEYNLSRDYTTFSGHLGLDDELTEDSSAEYAVKFFVDGTEKFTTTVTAGAATDFSVDVQNGLRLKIEVTRTGGGAGDSVLVIGDPRLTP
ncbi:NPCBM/NEW2 domain-containing protein [Kocuria sp. SM24M-10]|uniref:NPCBM/NEW2 domain-containing protein n=1 Tax=Kocuria sp. SM24M-10 TaxID=1660349 RepID=UPI000B298075